MMFEIIIDIFPPCYFLIRKVRFMHVLISKISKKDMTYISSQVVQLLLPQHFSEIDFDKTHEKFGSEEITPMVQRRLTKVLKFPITHIESGDVDEAKMGHVSLLDVRGKRKDVGIVIFDRDGNRFYFEWYGYSDAEETRWDDYHCRKRSERSLVGCRQFR